MLIVHIQSSTIIQSFSHAFSLSSGNLDDDYDHSSLLQFLTVQLVAAVVGCLFVCLALRYEYTRHRQTVTVSRGIKKNLKSLKFLENIELKVIIF